MGNKAIVVFADEKNKFNTFGLYLHWNGGAESVIAFLDYMQETRKEYGFSLERLKEIADNFFEGNQDTHVGHVGLFEKGLDNGIFYVHMAQCGYTLTRSKINNYPDYPVDIEHIRSNHRYWTNKEDNILDIVRSRNANKSLI